MVLHGIQWMCSEKCKFWLEFCYTSCWLLVDMADQKLTLIGCLDAVFWLTRDYVRHLVKSSQAKPAKFRNECNEAMICCKTNNYQIHNSKGVWDCVSSQDSFKTKLHHFAVRISDRRSGKTWQTMKFHRANKQWEFQRKIHIRFIMNRHRTSQITEISLLSNKYVEYSQTNRLAGNSSEIFDSFVIVPSFWCSIASARRRGTESVMWYPGYAQ